MIKRVDRYVGRAALLGTLLVWTAITSLYVLFSTLDELRSTQGGYDTLDALWFVTMTVPRMAYQVFPIAALLGSLVGVGGLAASNELVAFRTSGASRLRLAMAALGGTLVLMIPVVIMAEWAAPMAEQQARAFRLSEKVGHPIIGGASGIWIRDGAEIVNIERPVLYADRGRQTVDFSQVEIYRAPDWVHPESITRAARAYHDGGGWTLTEVDVVRFDAQGAHSERLPSMPWDTEIKPELLDSAVSRPPLLSMRALWDYLVFLGQNRLDDTVYQEAFWEKAAYPFSVIALVLAGMPFVFGQARSHSVGMRLFFGMTVGGLYMIASRSLQKVGNVYDIPPMLTYTVPVIVLALIAILALRRSV
ncbi:MAG: LPS export ABC transporter permease LptG [Xanthomonadales bacterium]